MIDRPSDLGMEPDGSEPPTSTDSPDVEHSFTRAEAVRTGRFWILVAASASVGMLSTALNFHQISLLGDAGLTAAEAAAMFLPQVVGTALAGVAFGWVSDRLSGRTLIPMSMSILAATLILAGFLDPGPILELYAHLLAHFPEYPLYGGEFTEIIPHLTVDREHRPRLGLEGLAVWEPG